MGTARQTIWIVQYAMLRSHQIAPTKNSAARQGRTIHGKHVVNQLVFLLLQLLLNDLYKFLRY